MYTRRIATLHKVCRGLVKRWLGRPPRLELVLAPELERHERLFAACDGELEHVAGVERMLATRRRR